MYTYDYTATRVDVPEAFLNALYNALKDYALQVEEIDYAMRYFYFKHTVDQLLREHRVCRPDDHAKAGAALIEFYTAYRARLTRRERAYLAGFMMNWFWRTHRAGIRMILEDILNEYAQVDWV